MFQGSNDNLTIDEFNANVEPHSSAAGPLTDDALLYIYQGERHQRGMPFALMRFGVGRFHRDMERQLIAYPTAGTPSPFCPENRQAPPPLAGQRYQPPSKVRKRPSYLQVVA
jgi:hypothetical protein